MNNLNANYERILEVLRKIATDRQLPVQRRRPAMSDLEVISLSLTAEYMGIDSENDLFRKLPCSLSNKIDRTVYNRRKRRLMAYQNTIRLSLAESFNGIAIVNRRLFKQLFPFPILAHQVSYTQLLNVICLYYTNPQYT